MATGRATLNFGAIGSVGNTASVQVALPSITTQTLVAAGLLLEATPEHSIDELLYDPIQVVAGAVAAGVGFTIYGVMQSGGAYGTYAVYWATV